MENGGCDKTAEMVEEAQRVLEQYGMYGTGAYAESEEPGTLWHPHQVHKGSLQLHAKGMFGKHRPLAYHSRIEAERIARKVGGTVANHKGKYHIIKHLSEDSTASQMSNLDAGDVGVQGGPLGESEPKKVKKLKSFKEEYGAGEDGSTEVVLKYQSVTPGQEKAHLPLKKALKVKKQEFVEDMGGAEAGTDAGAFMAYGEDAPKHDKTINTIKKVVRAKYKRKLI